MWDERYATDSYVFGTEPNDFLQAQVERIGPPPKRVLCLAEGEGRNGVYLAALGHQVTGVDNSAVGLGKAARLATERGVQLTLEQLDLTRAELPAEAFDAVVSIFCHLPAEHRPHFYSQIERTLKPGGCLLLEAYTPAQLGRGTGGPPHADRLVTARELASAFTMLNLELNRECDRPVIEGPAHSGMGAVVQCVASKPINA